MIKWDTIKNSSIVNMSWKYEYAEDSMKIYDHDDNLVTEIGFDPDGVDADSEVNFSEELVKDCMLYQAKKEYIAGNMEQLIIIIALASFEQIEQI